MFALRAGRESSAATRRPPAPPGVRPTPGKFVALGPARHGLSLDALAGEIRRARPCEDSGFGGQWGTLLTLPARRLCHQHPTGSVSGPGRLRAPPAEPRSRGSRGDLSRWRPLRDIFRARVRLSGEIRRASRSFARRPRGYRSQAVDGRVDGPPSGGIGSRSGPVRQQRDPMPPEGGSERGKCPSGARPMSLIPRFAPDSRPDRDQCPRWRNQYPHDASNVPHERVKLQNPCATNIPGVLGNL